MLGDFMTDKWKGLMWSLKMSTFHQFCVNNKYNLKKFKDTISISEYKPHVRVLYSPTDSQVNCLKNNFKIYIKIDIKTAPTCFGAITIIREHTIQAC
jgi:hypothetical protein